MPNTFVHEACVRLRIFTFPLIEGLKGAKDFTHRAPYEEHGFLLVQEHPRFSAVSRAGKIPARTEVHGRALG